ncbi:hypothetical protein RvY_11414 [Ramazzottius varieornatus]|uniref:Uncharacterized protein n=1 Tax=Ramazzottius varieornatus TaxID=947166 RepID=A0A1D1VLG7_RAMVA|nr:hypothetical protein RvY_11414 [Ramazzottius varieornatus]
MPIHVLYLIADGYTTFSDLTRLHMSNHGPPDKRLHGQKNCLLIFVLAGSFLQLQKDRFSQEELGNSAILYNTDTVNQMLGTCHCASADPTEPSTPASNSYDGYSRVHWRHENSNKDIVGLGRTRCI